MQKVTLEVSWGALWRVLFFVLFVAVMFLGRNILLGLFLALVISSGLDRFITYLENRGLPRTLAVIVIFLIGIFFMFVLLYSIVPVVIADIINLALGLRASVQTLGLEQVVNPEAIEQINRLIAQATETFLRILEASPIRIVTEFLGGIGLALSVFISSFYLSITRDGVPRFIRAVFPADHEELAIRIHDRSRKQIGLWFQNQIVLSFIIGFLVWLALTILGVKHAFLLALLAAAFEIVPYIGPILSGAAAFLVALTSSLPLAVYTLIAFLVIQQLENHVLLPLLTKRVVGLHPVIVITALLIGAEVGGFLGLVIAVPAAAVFQEVIDEWASRRKVRTAA
ncbi:MAG: AI-2E family transporter [Candidatus Liptonbacteria bacterium]|nr:AI-2E family transporter [Candidatus Liptonbacteria bacterium]